jgi:putative serine protease PepD
MNQEGVEMRKLHRRAAAAAAATLLVAAGAGIGAGTYAVSASGSKTKTTTVVREAAAPSAPTAPTAQTQSTALSVNQIYQRNYRGVVQISVDEQSQATGPFPFGGGGGSTQAQGSGFVYDSKGDIVTNEHVVSGATAIHVTFWDGKTYTAKLVGKDTSTDIAVVRVDAPASELHPLSLGSSSAVQVGDGVVAIGSPFGLAETVTSGIVSALHRQIDAPDNFPIVDAIQTDAAINHGNSGGVLLNMQGQVIGVTAQIESDSGGNDGVGFAIPSDSVKKVADGLISNGKVTHAYLGVSIQTATNGVSIGTVRSGAPAERAGLKAGDVVTAIDGTAVKSASALESLIAAKQPGDHVTLTIRRSGSTRTIAVTLGTRPS